MSVWGFFASRLTPHPSRMKPYADGAPKTGITPVKVASRGADFSLAFIGEDLESESGREKGRRS